MFLDVRCVRFVIGCCPAAHGLAGYTKVHGSGPIWQGIGGRSAGRCPCPDEGRGCCDLAGICGTHPTHCCIPLPTASYRQSRPACGPGTRSTGTRRPGASRPGTRSFRWTQAWKQALRRGGVGASRQGFGGCLARGYRRAVQPLCHHCRGLSLAAPRRCALRRNTAAEPAPGLRHAGSIWILHRLQLCARAASQPALTGSGTAGQQRSVS